MEISDPCSFKSVFLSYYVTMTLSICTHLCVRLAAYRSVWKEMVEP